MMAAVMGISMDIFEASDLDGCNSIQRFVYITLPLIRPILSYTLITSIIGGLQMFDVPQILTNGQGNPDRTSMTLIMFLNSHLKSRIMVWPEHCLYTCLLSVQSSASLYIV